MTTENVRKTTGLALQLAKEHGSNRLLFDISKMKLGQSSLQGFLDMKNMGATTGLMIENKCAVVYNPATYPTERAGFIEALVTNRPNPAFKMFKSCEAAIQWLKEL
ncbi:MAG: STAS/SEC14 domain-containing protein [Chitinophagales bacterium]|nr:STAS/SEC14 domain-containing protein [Chitinophagales bacterium]